MRGAKGRRASREGRVDAGLASLHELSASNAAWLNRISSMRRHDSYRFHRASGARSRPPPPTQEHVTLNTEMLQGDSQGVAACGCPPFPFRTVLYGARAAHGGARKDDFSMNRPGYHHPEARQLGSGVGRQELLRVGMRRVGLQRHGSLLNGRISTPALLHPHS